jgi:hypothetical protein
MSKQNGNGYLLFLIQKNLLFIFKITSEICFRLYLVSLWEEWSSNVSMLSFLLVEKHSLFKPIHLTVTEPSVYTASFTLLRASHSSYHKMNTPLSPFSDWKLTTVNFELVFIIM